MRLDEALQAAREQIDITGARRLLQKVSDFDPILQRTHPELVLSEAQCAAFHALVARRAQGEPLAYLLGEREFYGCTFKVCGAVLIPRPETEHLVEVACDLMAALPAPRICDLGTGSGVLAITLARLLPTATVVAVDASAEALAVARDNARGQQVEARIRFLQGHWHDPLGEARFDLIVANPPYIAADDPHLEEGDLRFEPRAALTDGSTDGLASLREIIAGATAHLSPGGWLWLEHGYDQAQPCREALQSAGFQEIRSLPDLAGHLRLTGGRVGKTG